MKKYLAIVLTLALLVPTSLVFADPLVVKEGDTVIIDHGFSQPTAAPVAFAKVKFSWPNSHLAYGAITGIYEIYSNVPFTNGVDLDGRDVLWFNRTGVSDGPYLHLELLATEATNGPITFPGQEVEWFALDGTLYDSEVTQDIEIIIEEVPAPEPVTIFGFFRVRAVSTGGAVL